MLHACVGMSSGFGLASGMPTQAWDMAPEYYQQELMMGRLPTRGTGAMRYQMGHP